jgi:hypothetical protein
MKTFISTYCFRNSNHFMHTSMTKKELWFPFVCFLPYICALYTTLSFPLRQYQRHVGISIGKVNTKKYHISRHLSDLQTVKDLEDVGVNIYRKGDVTTNSCRSTCIAYKYVCCCCCCESSFAFCNLLA